MADEAPPVVAPEVAPVIAEVAPVVEAPPAVVETPPAAEAPVVAEVPAAPAAPVDLLKTAVAEEAPKDPPVEAPPAEKPAEKPPEKPAEPEKPVEPKPEEKPVEVAPPAEPPAPQRLDPLPEYKYKLPAEIKFADDKQRDAFHTAIEDARNGNPQGLIDQHRTAMLQYAEQVAQGQRDVWNKTLQEWHDKTQEDPQVGGTKFAAVSRRGAWLRDNFVSTHPQGSAEWKAETQQFNDMLDRTGIGNHPSLWRWVDNIAKHIKEPEAPKVLDPKPAPTGKRGQEIMYDNPRSPRPNGPS